MADSIYTIPLNEIFETECGCPVCAMRNTLEQRCIEYIMGAAMMEPDVRIETNRLGFCKEHLGMMLAQRNRLSLALTLQTHLDEIRKNILNGKREMFQKAGKSNKISKINSTCYVCDKIDWALEGLLDTMFRLYDRDEAFRELYAGQQALCLPHYELVCSLAQDKLQKKTLNQFLEASTKLATGYLNTLYEDVSHFCKMFDYRNSGADADWKNSKDSVERAAWFLTSYEVK